ncbi:hypothetical protein [Phaeovulum vinaykumarii]|nr:hypothetical protein [Phaeovulum vinaykumarii]
MTRPSPAPSIPMASPAPMARFRMAPAPGITAPDVTTEAGR